MVKVTYNGEDFWLGTNGYYNNNNREQLHHKVWKDNSILLIRKGFVIHHKDFNKENNSFSNLQLLPDSEHRKLHMKERFKDQEYTKRNKSQLESIRDKSKAWHKSKEGIKWHSKHAINQWKNKKKISKKCIYCNADYEAYFERSKYCSRKCLFRDKRNVKKFYN